MNITDFKASLPYLFEAGVTPFVWGHAGIGKSSIVKQYAKEKGYHFFPLYLGTQSDLGDVLGLADFVRDEKGTAIATTFATPIWLRECIEYCENNPESGAILFLDEFNRARRDVLQGMFSLALDKTFHTIKLPKNCHIVAAGNPPTDEYQVTDVNETALMARFAHVKLEPSVQEWLTYARNNNFNSDLINFITQQPDLLADHKSDFKLPVKVDSRSYERMHKLFAVNTPPNLIYQLMQGILGLERTVAFQKYLSSAEKPLSAEDVLSGTKQDTILRWMSEEKKETTLITGTADNVSAYLAKKTDTLTTDEKKNLLQFLLTVSKEVAYVFIRDNLKGNVASFREFVSDREYEAPLAALVRQAKGLDK